MSAKSHFMRIKLILYARFVDADKLKMTQAKITA